MFKGTNILEFTKEFDSNASCKKYLSKIKKKKGFICRKCGYDSIHSDWLFPGREDKPVCSSTVQRVFGRAKKKLRLKKMQQYIHFGTALPPIC